VERGLRGHRVGRWGSRACALSLLNEDVERQDGVLGLAVGTAHNCTCVHRGDFPGGREENPRK
jgi:hypothetical protein